MSRSGLYKFKNWIENKKNEIIKNEENNNVNQIIIEAFDKNRRVFGRKRLSEYIRINYKILINYRTLGRKMQKLRLFCEIRQKRKAREKKNTVTEFQNIVARDNNDQNNLNIWASDVTYVQAPKDVFGNHIYFSAIINHKTKLIDSWNLSLENDTNLVMDHIKNFDFGGKFIFHTDHGSQYSSHVFKDMIKAKGGKQSMSRVGNSLDNREVEYFFSILKSECLKLLRIDKMAFIELKEEIKKFIHWYNNERIDLNQAQSHLNIVEMDTQTCYSTFIV